jgi:hypothetical protein
MQQLFPTYISPRKVVRRDYHKTNDNWFSVLKQNIRYKGGSHFLADDYHRHDRAWEKEDSENHPANDKDNSCSDAELIALKIIKRLQTFADRYQNYQQVIVY